jgi:hypothetical protein
MIFIEFIIGVGSAVLLGIVWYTGYVSGRFIERMKNE